MNIAALTTFLEVAETGHLNKAAERLHVTQSTVTTRINTLEDRLGQKLLVRSRSGAALTSAGFKFKRYAEMMVQAWTLAQQEVALPKGFDGVCNLGCHYDLWAGVGETWLRHMRRANPRVAVSVWAGDRGEIEQWLQSGMIDVAMLFDAQLKTDWTVEALFTDRLVQVATRKRSLMRWDPAYVYVDMGAEFRRRHAAAYPVDETPAVTFGNSAWALGHILESEGSGYLPLRLATPHVESGALHLVDGAPAFERTAYLAHDPRRTAAWPWFAGSVAFLRQRAAEDWRRPGDGEA